MAKQPDKYVVSASLLVILIGALALPGRLAAQSDSDARRVFDLTNQDRQQQGLPLLAWNSALAAAAEGHAQWMLREPSLSHQYPGEPDLMTRAARASAHFRAIAENIAIGPTPDSLEDQWMHSTPHRTNILDPKMNALGVAVLRRGPNLYAVEDFAQANEALTRAQVEDRVRALLHDQGVDASVPAAAAENACASGSGMPNGARSIVRFQTPDFSQLPSQVVQVIHSRDFRKAAVGACAPTSSQAAFTTYRVAIVFY
ncbi:MAG: CAP domain-containing protein [Acidobacteriaceae bacterium]